jgi:hypothetical protein
MRVTAAVSSFESTETAVVDDLSVYGDIAIAGEHTVFPVHDTRHQVTFFIRVGNSLPIDHSLC